MLTCCQLATCLLTASKPSSLNLAEVEVRYSSHELRFFSQAAAPAGRPAAAAAAAVLCRLSRDGWLRLAPLLRNKRTDSQPT